MQALIERSITVLNESPGTSDFPSEINGKFYVAIKLLEELQKADLSDDHLREKHDVIVVGLMAWVVKRTFVRGYLEAYPERYKINLELPFLKAPLVEMGQLDWHEDDEKIILCLGAALLFNKKYQGLFNPEDYPSDTTIGKVLHPWLVEHIKIYTDSYSPLNTYPNGNYSHIGLISRLQNASFFSKRAIIKELKKFNKETGTQVTLDKAQHFAADIAEVQEIARKRGGNLQLDQETIKALVNLKPNQRELLLQGYQFIQKQGDRPSIPHDVFLKIMSYVLQLNLKQCKDLHQFVAYSLFKNTPSTTPFWQKAFKQDPIKEEQLAKRLDCYVSR